ncbi:MAG: alcohol dehydrogenase catalytic domain-containing protein [Actinomycetota bacterium]|nr:alcohol dehydrogenase catalytic domain-containing protein [Actinomycetota bacterium]
MRILAAVVAGPGSAPELTEVDLPPLGIDDVRIRVAATGVCHTDIAWAAGEYGDQFPAVLGHETAGVVEEVGRHDSPYAVGDRVVVALTNHCGTCANCERGSPILCDLREDPVARLTGLDGTPIWAAYAVGGFAEAAVVRASSLVRIPGDVPFPVAAVVGCAVACGVGSVWNIAQVCPGSTVVVLGAGAVGAAVVLGCVLAGAERVVVVDPSGPRQQSALAIGATEAVDATDEVAERLSSEPFDYAFECVGKASAMETAVRLTRRGGTVTLMGAANREETFRLNALEFVSSQRRLLASLGGNVQPHVDFPRYFALYRSGRLNLDALVTATAPLDGIAHAFVANARATGLRTVVTMT